METLNPKKEIAELKERIKLFEEDRYCPNGCVEYQLDKIARYKEYFGEINESINLILSALQINPKTKNSRIYKELEKIKLICLAAVNGSKWI